jgi:GrpB-like predicted nucleotidyltransferase (UPF0157 family)
MPAYLRVRPLQGPIVETLQQKLDRVLREEVAVVPYDTRWPDLFRREKEHLLTSFPPCLLRRVEHFGSTAVPGLAAKPIIDVLAEVTNLSETRAVIAPVLEAQGYDYFWRPTSGDDGPPFYAWFIRRDPHTRVRTHHIHMVEPQFQQHWDRLLFRDYLIAYPHVAQQYQALKLRLAAVHPHDRVRYTQEKAAFVSAATEQACRLFGGREA